MFLQPETKAPEPNTYAENSDIDFLDYAIMFTKGNIVLEDSFNISNGKLNGYNVINSTININCSINNETRLNSISLYNIVQATIRNINETDLTIFLYDESSLILENCAFYKIWVLDSSSVIIENSTITYITVASPYGETGVYNYQTSVAINNSTMNNLYIREGCDLSIKNCTFLASSSLTISISSPATRVIGNIENSTLRYVGIGGFCNLKFYGSSLIGLYLYDMARATLIQSTITGYYRYGIVAYSGTTNIVEGTVSGSGYHNNTKLINSDAPTPLLISVAANGSAVVNMNNYSCSVYLHDTSSANIANVPDDSYFPSFYGRLMDSSSLTIENADLDWGDLDCMDNSKVVMRNSTLFAIYCDTSNSITIDDSFIYGILTYSSYSYLTNLAIDDVHMTNSTIYYMYVGGRDLLYVENCTIYYLYEGVNVYYGSLTLDSEGFSGTGNYKNSTALIDTDILFSRYLTYIEISGSAQLRVQDNFDDLDFFCLDNAELTCKNSSIDNIICQDTTTLMVENCTIDEYIILMDDSVVNATKNKFIDIIRTKGNSMASITNTTLYGIEIYESSIVMVENSNLLFIDVVGSNTKDYAVKIYDSKVELLATFTWS